MTRILKLLQISGLSALLLTLTLAPVHASGWDVGQTAGKTYGEWSAAWWQWAVSFPASSSPLLAQGALDCSARQGGPVWFLAGGPAGTAAVRSCSVPASKALFLPLLNLVYVNEPGENLTVAEKRTLLGDFLDDTVPGFLADLGFPGTRACALSLTVDGEPVSYSDPIVRVQSPPFRVDTGDEPISFPPNVIDRKSISDGFWAMLPPLSPGQHTLRIKARVCQFDNFDDHPLFGPIDVTYHLNVVGGGHGHGH